MKIIHLIIPFLLLGSCGNLTNSQSASSGFSYVPFSIDLINNTIIRWENNNSSYDTYFVIDNRRFPIAFGINELDITSYFGEPGYYNVSILLRNERFNISLPSEQITVLKIGNINSIIYEEIPRKLSWTNALYVDRYNFYLNDDLNTINDDGKSVFLYDFSSLNGFISIMIEAYSTKEIPVINRVSYHYFLHIDFLLILGNKLLSWETNSLLKYQVYINNKPIGGWVLDGMFDLTSFDIKPNDSIFVRSSFLDANKTMLFSKSAVLYFS
jgi:hypothetical protein